MTLNINSCIYYLATVGVRKQLLVPHPYILKTGESRLTRQTYN